MKKRGTKRGGGYRDEEETRKLRGVNDFSVISPVSLHNLGSPSFSIPQKVLMIAVSVDGKKRR